MSLVIVATNTTRLAARSDYEVVVRVGDAILATGIVKGHHRRKGWRTLLRKIARELPDHPRAPGMAPNRPRRAR